MKVVCIGSGHVSTHFALAFKAVGNEVSQVWSREYAHAEELAKKVGAIPLTTLAVIDPRADLYLVSIKDDAIAEISASLPALDGLVVHTSGATGLDVLSGMRHYGVLYPLQTFSKDRSISFSNVPLCIEANDECNLEKLMSLAKTMSTLVYSVDSEKRKALHLSAVFACNFVNHMYDLGNRILENKDLNFDMLRPLIMETALKVQQVLPSSVQTGPARRDDKQTISRHLELLSDQPELVQIYQLLTNSIKKTYY